MLSQFTWTQFFLFVLAGSLLWYLYVLFVYFGGSLNRLIVARGSGNQQVMPPVPTIPVARRPSAGSLIQTESFRADFGRTSADGVDEEIDQELSEDPKKSPPLTPDQIMAEEDAKMRANIRRRLEALPDLGRDNKPDAPLTIDDIILSPSMDADADMSPTVRAALSGEGFNWADDTALNMDYREPDEAAIEELESIDVRIPEDEEVTSDDEEEDTNTGLPAEDYIATVAELVKTEVASDQRELVLSSVQRTVGNKALAELSQNSPNAASNISWAVAELASRGQLTDAHREFSERFFGLKMEQAEKPAAANIDPEDMQALLARLS